MGVSPTQGQPQEVDHRGTQHSGEHYFFFLILAPHFKCSDSILGKKNEKQPTHSYMSIHICMEITGNGCILKQDRVMLTFPTSCRVVSLEGIETTQGVPGLHFRGFFGGLVDKVSELSLVKLRAGKEAE